MNRIISRRIEDYADIIELPHPVPQTRAPMSMAGRAAQFAPFAALEGYEDRIAETARPTQDDSELGEEQMAEISLVLSEIRRLLDDRDPPDIRAGIFVRDERKPGGSLQTVSGRVKKLFETEGQLILESGRVILFETLRSLEIRPPEVL